MFERLFARRGLSIDRLRVLCEVADAGSIARAAGEGAARQSQFSRQLKELEDFFEVELTRRQGKVLVLTAAGRELAQIAREALGRLHDFHARASAQPVSFSIGAGDSLLQWLVLPRLAVMGPQLRGVNVRVQNLRTAEITNRLHDLSLDFGLVRREAVSAPLKCAPLGKMEYALFCPRSRFDKVPDARRAIETLPLAMQSGDGIFTRQFRGWAEKNDVKVCVKIECDAFPQASRAVQSGQCAAILPKIARGDLPGDAFWEIDVPFLNKKPRQVCLAWNPRTIRLRSEAQELVTRLTETLKF
jgi:DNA-binding transcriptional LysR family regulator